MVAWPAMGTSPGMRVLAVDLAAASKITYLVHGCARLSIMVTRQECKIRKQRRAEARKEDRKRSASRENAKLGEAIGETTVLAHGGGRHAKPRAEGRGTAGAPAAGVPVALRRAVRAHAEILRPGPFADAYCRCSALTLPR